MSTVDHPKSRICAFAVIIAVMLMIETHRPSNQQTVSNRVEWRMFAWLGGSELLRKLPAYCQNLIVTTTR